MIALLRGAQLEPSVLSALVVMLGALQAAWLAPSGLLPGSMVIGWGEVVGWGLVYLLSPGWCL